MSVPFKKVCVGASVLALFVLVSGASAAISLGFPAGKPYYGSSNRQLGSSSYRSYSPTYSTTYSTETRQSFSYDSAESGVQAQGGCDEHAAAPQAAKQDASTKDVAAAPQTVRRSYSYEPAPQRRGYSRRSAPRKEAWQYQKTDPRRQGR